MTLIMSEKDEINLFEVVVKPTVPVVCEGSNTCHLDIAIRNQKFAGQADVVTSVCGMRFETNNWNTPQSFLISCVKDQFEDGEQDHIIEVGTDAVLEDISEKRTPYEWLLMSRKSMRVRFTTTTLSIKSTYNSVLRSCFYRLPHAM